MKCSPNRSNPIPQLRFQRVTKTLSEMFTVKLPYSSVEGISESRLLTYKIFRVNFRVRLSRNCLKPSRSLGSRASLESSSCSVYSEYSESVVDFAITDTLWISEFRKPGLSNRDRFRDNGSFSFKQLWDFVWIRCPFPVTGGNPG